MENYVKVKQTVTLVTGALKQMNLFIVWSPEQNNINFILFLAKQVQEIEHLLFVRQCLWKYKF